MLLVLLLSLLCSLQREKGTSETQCSVKTLLLQYVQWHITNIVGVCIRSIGIENQQMN